VRPRHRECRPGPNRRPPAFVLACALALPAALAACAASAPVDRRYPDLELVRHWGTLREALREGHTEGRVALAEAADPRTVGIGFLPELAGELTVDGGRAWLAEVTDAASPDGLTVRGPRPGEQATVLVLSRVDAWSEDRLEAVADFAELEELVRATARVRGFDVTRPFPFRVTGRAAELHLHVLDHSCPIAAPDGPPPWRHTGTDEPVVLVGFYAEGSGGVLTHHGERSHVHALVDGGRLAGHADGVRLEPGAVLFLPVPTP